MATFSAGRDLEKEVTVATVSDRYALALAGVSEAAAGAPIVTGAYAGGMHARRYGNGTVVMVDDDEDARYKEYGTVDTPAHAELTNAARRRGTYRGR